MSWPKVTLGEILVPATDRIRLEPEATYAQITARLWGKGLTLRGRLKGLEIAADQQMRVSVGQFLISKIDARHGAFGIVPEVLAGAVVSNDFPVFDVSADRALPEYMAWVGRTDWFVDLCRRASEGSTNRVRLKEARFLAQAIPLPPIDEQRRIVARLDAASAAVAARRSAADAVDAEIVATLRNAFARVAAEAPLSRMGDIAPLVRRSIAINPEATYPELGVRSFGKGTFHKPSLPGLEVGSKKLFSVEAGDLIFNIVFAWEGAVAVASEADSGRVGSHRFLTCVTDPSRASANFLRYWFLSEEGLLALNRASPGGAGRNRTLGIKALEAIAVPVPSLNAQRWFDRIQDAARTARVAQADAATHLDRLLPALLHETFA